MPLLIFFLRGTLFFLLDFSFDFILSVIGKLVGSGLDTDWLVDEKYFQKEDGIEWEGTGGVGANEVSEVEEALIFQWRDTEYMLPE